MAFSKSVFVSSCTEQARRLIESAKAVHITKNYGVSYHLSLLAIEELAKSEMVLARYFSSDDEELADIHKMDDHETKIIWAITWRRFEKIIQDPKELDSIKECAKKFHAKRLSAVYVSVDTDATPPFEVVCEEESNSIIDFAAGTLNTTPAPGDGFKIPDELVWLASKFDDEDFIKFMFGQHSLAKALELSETGGSWIAWLKTHVEGIEKVSQNKLKAEFERIVRSDGGSKDPKWNTRRRLHTATHSLRSSFIRRFNELSKNFVFVSDAGSKYEIDITVQLPQSVHIANMPQTADAIHKITCMSFCIGTQGLFWYSGYCPSQEQFDLIKQISGEIDGDIAVRRQDTFNDFPRRTKATDTDASRIIVLWSWLISNSDFGEADFIRHYNYATFLSYKSDQDFSFIRQIVFNFYMAAACFCKMHISHDIDVCDHVGVILTIKEFLGDVPPSWNEALTDMQKRLENKGTFTCTMSEALTGKAIVDLLLIKFIKTATLEEYDEAAGG